MRLRIRAGETIVKWMAMLWTVLVICLPVLAQVQPAHDREFWRAIAKSGYAVPAGQPVLPLVRELSGYLGSRDPELRDDLAYGVIATWVVGKKQLSKAELNAFANEWRANLRIQGSESGADSVLLRSYSALCLAALTQRDLKDPFFGEERYRSLLADALAYLKSERDLRGFDPTLGWIHATAHTADLLAALVANPLFEKDDQAQVLNAVSQRLSSANQIFIFGEQDRLAQVVGNIVKLKDFDLEAFRKWLGAVDAMDELTWKNSPPKLDQLQTFENDTYMLRALAASLSTKTREGAAAEAQMAVLESLRKR